MLPKVGSEIEVVVRNRVKTMLVWYPETSTFKGTVVTSFPWLDADNFCMTSGTGFVRSISMKSVVQIRDSKGAEMPLPKLGDTPKNREWTVKGSKGDVYTVSRSNGKFSCNCVAGQFRKSTCKHIKKIQAEEA